ncbi:Protein PLANT CADMIUM RESISTANCE 10 [Glycine max]|nr:Protein PLANT CADMIUM RESISTANCE 10 [Glycine max]
MKNQHGYVPPAYIPLGPSDSEAVDVSLLQRSSTNGSNQMQAQWSSGICACCDDMQSCIGCLCPCFLFGKNADFLGSGTFLGSCVTHFILWSVVNTACCLLTDGLFWGLPGCLVSCYACGYRKALRSKYNLPVMLLQLCFALTLYSKVKEQFLDYEEGRFLLKCFWYCETLLNEHSPKEAPCGDFVTHFCCHPCAICQEYREIRERSGDCEATDLKLAVVTAPPIQTMHSDSKQ